MHEASHPSERPPGLTLPLTSAERSLVDVAERFANDMIAPRAERLEREKSALPAGVVAEWIRLGLNGMQVSPERGGAGASFFAKVAVAEAIARSCFPCAFALINMQGAVTRSAETIAELEARGLLYILGVRERTDKLVRELVLDHPGPFIPLVLTKRAKDIEYEAKAVTLAGRRYVVCRNRDEMKKDAAARAAILAALERQLKKGDKSLIGNKGYRRFLATPGDDHFAIDRAKAEEDAKFDGVFVLRTNADLSPLEAMLCYKQLWMVERAFRTSKSLFATRPIFHKLDETIRGHVSCSFLALLLKKELEDRVANIGKPLGPTFSPTSTRSPKLR